MLETLSRIVGKIWPDNMLFSVGQLVAFWIFLICGALFPFLFQGKVFIDADATLYYYPVFDFYHRALVSGDSFLWNPSILLGFPTYLSQSAGFLDPLNLLLFHLPTFTAYHLRLCIDFLLVFVFSYLLGRELGRTRLASLMIGMGYLLAFNWRYLSNVVISNNLFLVPFLWYGGLRLFRAVTERERWFWIAIMGASIGWTFIAGYAQHTIYTLTLFGAFYVYLYHEKFRSFSLTSDLFRWVGYGTAIVAVGFVFGLPQILPALKFAEHTVRAEGVAYEQAVYKTVEYGDVILFALPDYLYFPYLSSGRKPLYVGALLFLLAVIALREVSRKSSSDSLSVQRAKMIAWLFAFCFVVSLKWSPVFYLMQKLPIFELFRFPYRWMYIGAFFLAVLGAYGFDLFYERRRQLSSSWVVYGMTVSVSLFVLLVASLNFLNDRIWEMIKSMFSATFENILLGKGPFLKNMDHYEGAMDRGLDAWQTFLSISDVSFLFPFLILIISTCLVACVVWLNLSRLAFRVGSFMLMVITFFGTFAVQWPYAVSRDFALAHENVLNDSINIDDLQSYRTFPYNLGLSLSEHIVPTYRLTNEQVVAIAEMQFQSGWPNMHMYDSRVSSVDGYDPFARVDLVDALGMIGSTHAGEEVTKRIPEAQKHSSLLEHIDTIGMLSGKYLISGVPLSHEYLVLRATTSVSHLGGTVYMYENKSARPRWYLAEKVIERPGVSLPELVRDSDSWPKNLTYLDCVDCAGEQTISEIDKLEGGMVGNAKAKFSLQVQYPRWFVFNESNLPGWDVTIDGKDAEFVAANGVGMGLLIPSGNHEIEFEYEGVIGENRLLRILGIFD